MASYSPLLGKLQKHSGNDTISTYSTFNSDSDSEVNSISSNDKNVLSWKSQAVISLIKKKENGEQDRSVAAVRALLEEYLSLVDYKDPKTLYEDSMMMIAAWHRRHDIIAELIKLGANVNLSNKISQTALHLACMKNSIESLELLVNHGGDIEGKDREGRTPLNDACANNSTECVEFLISKGANLENTTRGRRTPLVDAWSNGSMECLQKLIDCGVNLEASNQYGWTCLHFACANKLADFAILLIERGANCYRKNCNGKIPLDLWEMNEQTDARQRVQDACDKISQDNDICCIFC